MSGGIIAIIIAVLALIALIVFGIMIGKKVSSLMKEIDNTSKTVQNKLNFFSKEADAIKLKIDQMTQKVNGMTAEMNGKTKNFEYLSESTADFQNALDELKQAVMDLFTQFFSFSHKKSSSEASTFTVLKKTVQKLAQKQKAV